MIDRIKAAGYQGFCLTVDSARFCRKFSLALDLGYDLP